MLRSYPCDASATENHIAASPADRQKVLMDLPISRKSFRDFLSLGICLWES
jgi:hypothetical protein